MRRFIAVLWAVFGCVGLGVFLGYLWLDRALDRTRWAKPTVQFVERGQSARSECPTLPRSVNELSRAVRRNPETDLSTYVTESYRCASDHEARTAFLIMLRTTARSGDGFAERALEVVIHSSCETLHAVAVGADPTGSHAIAGCVELMLAQALSMDTEAEVRRRVLRIAEIHALIEAEVASEELQEQFCAEVELVPAEVFDRLSGKHPALAATIASVCRVGIPSDAGSEE